MKENDGKKEEKNKKEKAQNLREEDIIEKVLNHEKMLKEMKEENEKFKKENEKYKKENEKYKKKMKKKKNNF